MLRIFFKIKGVVHINFGVNMADTFKHSSVFFLLVLVLQSCSQRQHVEDVSNVQLELKKHRFEQKLFAIDGTDAFHKIDQLKLKHPVFFDLFTKYMVRTASSNDSLSKASLLGFVKDKDIQSVYQESQKVFPELDAIHESLTDAFKRYHKAFPSKPVPEIYTFISGFNYAVMSADSILGIGLDMYLGADYKYYPMLGLPKYKLVRMRKEYIVTDAIKGWAQSEYEMDGTKKDFLSNVVYQGKLLYFQDALLPESEDSLKIGYTADQLAWCDKSEVSIWSFFIEKKLLYSVNYTEYMKFITEGPTTSGFPKEAPSMIGNWLGWQIVRKYMKENPTVTLEQLMNEPDAQKILTLSKYKPVKQ